MLHDAHRSSERVGTRFWFSRGRAVSSSWPSWPGASRTQRYPATVSRGVRYRVVLDRACALRYPALAGSGAGRLVSLAHD